MVNEKRWKEIKDQTQLYEGDSKDLETLENLQKYTSKIVHGSIAGLDALIT